MGVTNFPHGISSFGVPLLGSGPILTTGNIWFCDSGSAHASDNAYGNQGKSTERPFATLDYAIGRCTASNGDHIVLMPGHAETVSAALDIVCDVAGITIVGLGTGALQPTITFDTADTASMSVTADSITFDHVWFIANFANVDGAIEVAATGTNFCIKNSRITATAAALDFETFLTLAAAANGFKFIGNDVHMIEGTDGENLVITAGECTNMRVTDNVIVMEASESIFDLDATAITGGPYFARNSMLNLTAAADYCVEIDGATVGFFVDERYACGGEAIPIITTTVSFFVNCFGSELANVSSLIFPKTATAWP